MLFVVSRSDSCTFNMQVADTVSASPSSREDFAQVIRHGVSYLPSRILPGALAVVSIAAFARLLGPAAYGRYTLIVLAGTYSGVILSEWIIYAFQRFYLAADDLAMRAAAAEARGWRLIITAAGSFVIALAGALLHVHLLVISAVIMTMWGGSVYQLAGITLTLQERIRSYRYLQAAVSTAKFVVVLLSIVIFRTSEAAAFAGGLAALVAVASCWRHKGLPARPRPTLSSLRAIVGFGLPMLLVSSGLNVLATMDRYVMSGLRGDAAAGRYAAGYLLAEQSVVLLFSVLLISTYPRVVRAWERGGRADAGRLASRAASMHLRGVVPVIVVLTYGSTTICRVVLGAGYTDPAILPLVALGASLLALSQYANLGVQMNRRPWIAAIQVGFAAVLNVALCFALIPRFGGVGAAWATVATYALVASMALWFNRGFFDPWLVARENGYYVAAGTIALGLATISPPPLAWAILGVYLSGWCAAFCRAASRSMRGPRFDAVSGHASYTQ